MEWKVYFEDNPAVTARIGAAPGRKCPAGHTRCGAGSISSSRRFTFVEKGWL